MPGVSLALSIGSTLFVKGLEFDRGIIVHATNMTRKDWYVALTRGTRSGPHYAGGG